MTKKSIVGANDVTKNEFVVAQVQKSNLNVQGKQKQNSQTTIRIYEPTITKYWIKLLKAK